METYPNSAGQSMVLCNLFIVWAEASSEACLVIINFSRNSFNFTTKREKEKEIHKKMKLRLFKLVK